MKPDKAELIEIILKDCLFRDEEIKDGKPPDDAILVKGIIHNFGFHRDRLQSHAEEVRYLLDQMPHEFHQSSGGGWSFLNLCMDKDGHQWGEQSNMEQLIVLAIGLGMAKFQMPREMWNLFPGGMPYVVFDTRPNQTKDSNP